MSDKAHLSVVVCGHVDAGKSTTCGHLIFKCGGIPEREMAKLQERAEEMGKASFGFAYFLDTCKEERERGVTIQCNTKEFYTDKYHYTIVDAPGHKVSTIRTHIIVFVIGKKLMAIGGLCIFIITY